MRSGVVFHGKIGHALFPPPRRHPRTCFVVVRWLQNAPHADDTTRTGCASRVAVVHTHTSCVRDIALEPQRCDDPSRIPQAGRGDTSRIASDRLRSFTPVRLYDRPKHALVPYRHTFPSRVLRPAWYAICWMAPVRNSAIFQSGTGRRFVDTRRPFRSTTHVTGKHARATPRLPSVDARTAEMREAQPA